MSDIAALKAAVDAAEAAEEELIAERRANRASMSKADFKAYNEETRAAQVDLAKAVAEANQALQAALNNARQEILVNAIGETNTAGGAS